VDHSSDLCSTASLPWYANGSGLPDVSPVVPGLTVWSLLAQLWPGKWHRPSAVTQKRHQQRAKGEAAKQRASEQPVFMNLSLERVCMKMWCLNRDPANKWREYDRCGVAFPWPMSQQYFWETPGIWQIFVFQIDHAKMSRFSPLFSPGGDYESEEVSYCRRCGWGCLSRSQGEALQRGGGDHHVRKGPRYFLC